MTKIKIDPELIDNIADIWLRNVRELIKREDIIEGQNIPRVAGYLTIAYMFGAERDDEDRPKCEVCGHTPRCTLFGPSPTTCDWCGTKLVVKAVMKEERVCGDCGHFDEDKGCSVTSGGEMAKATDPVIKCEKFKPKEEKK